MGDPVQTAHERLDYPRLNPSFVAVALDENTVHVRAGPWNGPIKTITDPHEDGHLAPLFDVLDGRTHVTELLDAVAPDHRSDVAELLVTLHEDGILYDGRVRPDAWSHLSIKPDFREEPDLSGAPSVVVIAAGELGRQVAEDLVSYGFEGVELAIPSRADGVESTAPTTSVDLDGDGIEMLLDRVSFAVTCADRPRRGLFHQVNRAAVEVGTPWVAAQVLGYTGLVGPAVFPGETACYACFERRLRSNAPNPEACERYLAAGSDASAPANHSLVRSVAGYLGMDVLHLLAFGSGYTAGRVFTVDATTLSFSVDDVLRVPRCEVCSDHGSPRRPRFLTMADLVDLQEDGR